MTGKLKLNFLDELNLGKFYSIKNFNYVCEQINQNVNLEIYWKQQQIHIKVKNDYLEKFSFIFNKNGQLEYSFNHTDNKFLFLHLQVIINTLNQNFNKLSPNITKIQLGEESLIAFPPYVFQNEENSIDNIYYNEVKLKIIDLDFSAIFTGHIIRKYNNLYYVVTNDAGDIVSLLKLRLKNDNWYFIDANYKGVHIDPPLLLNAFFIPLDGQNLIDVPIEIKQEELLTKLSSLNIYL